MSDAMGALLAVEEIINDLSDRRGLGHEWGSIDDEIQSEIMEGWRVIIDARVVAAVAAEREAIALWLEGTHRRDGHNCNTRPHPTGTTTAQFGCGNCGKADAIRARGSR